jgi:sulfatase maturation enzyme AslB (radical SAM superfamily)
MPCYKCNLDCEFCYLDLKSRKTTEGKRLELLSPHDLNSCFADVKLNDHKIKHIDIYGGELACLGDMYVTNLINQCKDELTFHHANNDARGKKRISLITNATILKDYMLRSDINLVVSFNADDQMFHQRKENIINYARTREVNLLTLDISFKTREDIKAYLDFVRKNNIASFEIKEYTKSESSLYIKDDIYYDDVVIAFIEILSSDYNDLLDRFVNLQIIEEVLNHKNETNYMFLQPDGRPSVISFKDGQQFFKPISGCRALDFHKSINSLHQASLNGVCRECNLWGKCLIEHPREIINVANGCPGHSKLLYWYQSEYKKKG